MSATEDQNPEANETKSEEAARPTFRVVGGSAASVVGRLFQLPADMTIGAFRTAARAGEYIFAGERSFIPSAGTQLEHDEGNGRVHSRLTQSCRPHAG